jgi:formate-dependent phosphoribosylglycinamide formyltransferase (GAR transformylase)
MHEQRRRQDGEVIPTITLVKCEVHRTGIRRTDTIKLVLALAWH